jgi:NADH-quinone oxidoreductase subunit M
VNEKMDDLNMREVLYFAPLVAAAFWIGLYPKPIMDVMDAPVRKLVMQVNPGFYEAEALAAKQITAAKLGMQGMAAPHHAGSEAEGPSAEPMHPAGHGEAPTTPTHETPAHGGGK